MRMQGWPTLPCSTSRISRRSPISTTTIFIAIHKVYGANDCVFSAPVGKVTRYEESSLTRSWPRLRGAQITEEPVYEHGDNEDGTGSLDVHFSCFPIGREESDDGRKGGPPAPTVSSPPPPQPSGRQLSLRLVDAGTLRATVGFARQTLEPGAEAKTVPRQLCEPPQHVEVVAVVRDVIRHPPGGLSAPASAPHRAAAALATAIGEALIEFPGGRTGWLLRPESFAVKLHDVLG
jgi:hypothetical protein